MKKTVSLIFAAVLIFSLVSCAGGKTSETETAQSIRAQTEKADETEESGLSFGFGGANLLSAKLTVSEDKDAVSKDEKFGAAFLGMNQEEFESIGFRLGDSCDVVFENGYSLYDVPYYNGYYVRNGDPVIVAYPGDPYVRITLNNMGIWDAAGLKEGDGVTVTLSEAGKYSAVQEALGQIYSFDREEYPSDESFANFRSFSAGNLRENFLFRGASPVDNSRKRAPIVNDLIKENGVRFVIDLADSEENMKKYIASDDFKSEYAKELYEDGKIVLLDMGSAYMSAEYKEKVASGFRAALSSDGPIYIHCMEGKDRTGFVCLLIEALAGASYDEMMKDYMTTYDNYFRVSKEETPEKYDAIVNLYFVPFAEFLHGTSDIAVLEKADYTEDAASYLRDGGMTDSEISDFVSLISK